MVKIWGGNENHVQFVLIHFRVSVNHKKTAASLDSCQFSKYHSKKIHIFYSYFSAEVTAKYFGQLSDEDIYNIYTVYEDDFKLFDYHFKFRNISLP